MPRKNRIIDVHLLPIQKVDAQHPCPWIRATEVLLQAAEQFGLLQPDRFTGESHGSLATSNAYPAANAVTA